MSRFEELVARASRPELAPLWDELFRRMGASSKPVVTISLRNLDNAERTGIANLLGWDRLPLRDVVRVRTDDLNRALRLDDEELRALVEAIHGPIPNRAAEREAKRIERENLWSWFRSEVERWPLDAWVDRLQVRGIWKDVPSHRRQLEVMLDVLSELPAEGIVLSVLARSATGDPHGLDGGRWIPNRLLEAIAAITNQPNPQNAEESRRLWDRVGVVTDTHSVSVTVLGVRSNSTDPLAGVLAKMANAAEPYAITLSQLQRWPIRIDPCRVYLFENASVLSVATGMAWSKPPIISTAGWPNTAVFVLCRQLRDCGCELLHHGDFDPTGIEITRYLLDRAGAVPWRMTAADYQPLAAESSTTFDAPVVDTPWDPELSKSMNEAGVVVYEEDVVTQLLHELRIIPDDGSTPDSTDLADHIRRDANPRQR